MTPREKEEYRALRATIRERGTLRICVFAAGIAAWAALALATAVLMTTPLAVLLPLMVLAAVFEAVFAVQVEIGRIGRYLRLFHDDRWEQVAIELRGPARMPDGLFVLAFLTAVVINLAPLLVANPVAVEWIFVGGAHGLVVVRLLAAQAAARERAADVAQLSDLKAGR